MAHPGSRRDGRGGRPKSPDKRPVGVVCTRLHAMRTDFRLTLYSDCLGANRKTRFIVCNRVQVGSRAPSGLPCGAVLGRDEAIKFEAPDFG